MKAPSVLLLAAVAVLAFSAGYYFGAPGQLIGSPQLQPQQLASNNASPQDDSLVASPSASANSPLDPTTARERAFAILSIPHDVERMRAFCDFLPSVDRANWRQALDAFLTQEKTEGRFRDAEFQLLLDQIGRVDPKAGVSEIVFSKDSQLSRRSYRILSSWAASNPAEAVAWFEEDVGRRAAYLPAVIDGLAKSEPHRARSLLYAAPANTHDSVVGSLVYGIVTTQGFRRAEEFYESVRQDPQASPELIKEMYYKLSNSRVEIAQAQKDAVGLLAWADREFPAGRSQGVGILTSAARMDGLQTFTWLDARRDRLSKENADFLCGAVAAQWQSNRPEEALQWLTANPDHPQRDAMAIAIAIARSQDHQFPQAQAALATITDPERRSAAESQVLKSAPQFRGR